MITFEPESVDDRMFLVGCSRSGTTLLQSLIASHQTINSFPETRFFLRNVRNTKRKYLLKFGIATGRECKHIKAWLNQIGRHDLCERIPQQPFLFRSAVEIFLALLDHITANERKNRRWLEKSPLHIRYIKSIERCVPEPIIIHIIRDGKEVVASLYDRAKKSDKKYFKHHLNIDNCIRLWNECMSITDRYAKKENHLVLKYKKLIENPIRSLNKLESLLDISYSSEMLKNRQKKAQKYILKNETWKSGVKKNIKDKESKFEKLFNETEKLNIKESLNNHDILKPK